jgi:glycosyltransferase involved in cell wall biosynthesis
LSPSGLSQLREKHSKSKQLPAYIIPHGHFRGAYPDKVTKAKARDKLGLEDGSVILFFGQIRRYKNVPKLVTCFRETASPDWILLIVGEPRDPLVANEVICGAANCNRIRLAMKFINDDCLQIYLRASDLVVLPYTDILNSGAAILALSFDRPVLVPAKGAMSDLQALVGKRWVMTYDGDLSAATLRAAVAWSRARLGAERAPLERLDWRHIQYQTAEVFRHTVARAHPSAACWY